MLLLRDANYNRAFNLLKDNPSEQRLDIMLPRANYLRLENSFLKLYPESLELRYPSLSYDSFTETVTVIVQHASDYLSTYRQGLASTISYYGSTTTNDFSGAFEEGTKQPDGGVRYFYSDRDKVTAVVELGFSEDYTSLCRDKDMWIDGHGVNVFILVCLTEKPRFKNPTTEYGDIGGVDAAIALMRNTINETLGLKPLKQPPCSIFVPRAQVG
ncbi:hypothetical protein V1517DRAFT_340971 [Lipomyces orientalis]|uniref:Uncharacterized protein n=1 Tax=Lipomyces orientalis TaxID=1233043 RepID=A0ACC3TGD3_9ASCO